MNSLSDIWNTVIENLAKDLTSTAITTWFSDCRPVDITDQTLVIHTSSGFKREIISRRFAPAIKEALSDIFSCDFDLMILAEDEINSYNSDMESDDTPPEMAAYSFDNFVIGNSNKFAHAAAVGVAEAPGTTYNPLFIFGSSGLGKTHLLLAIGQYIHEISPTDKIAYVKGDEFANGLITSIRTRTQEEFRIKYRNVDLFLVDDIQFIAGMQRVQDEFFHTFNTLFEAGKQIVITSDRPPIEMETLEDRLRTRFEGGLMADVQPPDLETRIAIIKNKASQLGMVLTDEVVNHIAENITSNIRQIEGVVKKLTAYRDIMNDTISITSVKRAIKDVIRLGVYVPTPDVIIDETARYYALLPDELRSQRRTKNTAMARQVSMYLMRSLTNISLKDIGAHFGDRNHTTVLSSIRKVETLLKSDPDMAAAVRDITSNINSKN